jgi:hypothetical protein
MERLKFLSTKGPKGSGKAKEITSIILGLLIVLSLPILPVWGLRLMGIPVGLTFSSWGGVCVISLFILMLIRFSRIKTD